AVNELIDDYKVARWVAFPERTARRHRDEISDAGALERIDIGAEVDRRGRQLVAAAVPRKEANGQSLEFGKKQRIGGTAPRRGDLPPLDVLEPRQIIDPAAPNDAKDRLRHSLPPSCGTVVFVPAICSVHRARSFPRTVRACGRLMPPLQDRGPG